MKYNGSTDLQLVSRRQAIRRIGYGSLYVATVSTPGLPLILGDAYAQGNFFKGIITRVGSVLRNPFISLALKVTDETLDFLDVECQMCKTVFRTLDIVSAATSLICPHCNAAQRIGKVIFDYVIGKAQDLGVDRFFAFLKQKQNHPSYQRYPSYPNRQLGDQFSRDEEPRLRATYTPSEYQSAQIQYRNQAYYTVEPIGPATVSRRMTLWIPETRAVLCQNVVGLEPVNEYDSEIHVFPSKLSYFTEVKGATDYTHITHTYLFDGQRVFQIPLQIRPGSRFRTHSHKKNGLRRYGNWIVLARTSRGDVLACNHLKVSDGCGSMHRH